MKKQWRELIQINTKELKEKKTEYEQTFALHIENPAGSNTEAEGKVFNYNGEFQK